MSGEALKKERERLGLTQEQLANILEVKPNTVYRWEKEILKVPKTVELAMKALKQSKN